MLTSGLMTLFLRGSEAATKKLLHGGLDVRLLHLESGNLAHDECKHMFLLMTLDETKCAISDVLNDK
jgi:hypothetical protein